MLYFYNKLLKVDYLYKFKNNYRVKKYVYEEIINHKIRACHNCNGLGWIAWKSNINSSGQPTIILYSICIKCQLK